MTAASSARAGVVQLPGRVAYGGAGAFAVVQQRGDDAATLTPEVRVSDHDEVGAGPGDGDVPEVELAAPGDIPSPTTSENTMTSRSPPWKVRTVPTRRRSWP